MFSLLCLFVTQSQSNLSRIQRVASMALLAPFSSFCRKSVRLPNSILPDRCYNLEPVFFVAVTTGSLTAIAANALINSIILTFNSLVELGWAAALRFAGMCNRLASWG